MSGHSIQRFGPFVIVRTLGRGGMGEVFLARTPWPERPVAAVKRLRPDVARVPTFAERFRHEAALAVRLDHANLVATLDVGAVDEQLYVASELVLGKDAGYVADRLRMRSQGGPAAVALHLLLDGLSGLAYVHGALDEGGRPLGLVHRDITPGNVLIGYDGRARLADFGLAKSHLSGPTRLTQHGEILGTPHYLPPEVVRGEAAIPASDIYGLGSVIYRFLTGVAPFQGNTSEVLMKVLSEQPRPLHELRPDLPGFLVEIIHQMLSPHLEDRPANARDLAERVLAHARAEDFLVPRSSAGRWLEQLFDAEHSEEMEEYERLTSQEALDPRFFEPAQGGTVVLARAVEAPRLSDGHPFLGSMADVDLQGTELELVASSVLGVAPPHEDDEAEMPTRAVHAFPPPPGPVDRQTLDPLRLPGFADPSDPPAPPTDKRPVPDPKSAASEEAERSDERLVMPVEDAGPPQVTLSTPALRRRWTFPWRGAQLQRSVLLMAGLLSLALALVIGVGKVVRLLRVRDAQPVLIETGAKARLDALNDRLEEMQARGQSISPAAWRHVAQAASALLTGDEFEAERHLSAAEDLVPVDEDGGPPILVPSQRGRRAPHHRPQ